jgi:hypothetical protein
MNIQRRHSSVIPKLTEDLQALHTSFEPQMKHAVDEARQDPACMAMFARWANYPKDMARCGVLVEELRESEPAIHDAEICQELIAYFQREKSSLPYTSGELRTMHSAPPEAFSTQPLADMLDQSIALCEKSLRKAGGPVAARELKIQLTPHLARYGALDGAYRNIRKALKAEQPQFAAEFEAVAGPPVAELVSLMDGRILKNHLDAQTLGNVLKRMHGEISDGLAAHRLTEQAQPLLNAFQAAAETCDMLMHQQQNVSRPAGRA